MKSLGSALRSYRSYLAAAALSVAAACGGRYDLPVSPPCGPAFTYRQELRADAPSAGAAFGTWMQTGDVNADGFPDIAVAAPHQPVGGAPDAGAVYLFLGPLHDNPILVTAPMPEGGPAKGDQFGTVRTGLALGDLDGVPGDEMVVGAPYRDFSSGGKAYTDIGAVIVYGWDAASGGMKHLRTLFPPHDDPASIPGGSVQTLGMTVMTGDVDGDGYRDIVAGAPGARRVFIYRGGPDPSLISESLADTTRIKPVESAQDSGFGNSVAVADVDGDGRAEVAVAEEKYGIILKGRVTVYAGAGLVPGSTVPASCGAAWCYQVIDAANQTAGALFGEHLSFQSLDPDGRPVLSVFAEFSPSTPSPEGVNYLYLGSGAPGQWFAAAPDLTLYPPPDGMSSGGRFGRNVVAMDVDGDGIPDAAVNQGAWDDPDGCGPGIAGPSAGRVHIYRNPFVQKSSRGLANLLGDGNSPYLTIYNQDPRIDCSAQPPEGEQFGIGLNAVDLNGDGRDDLLIGLRHGTVDGLTEAGRTGVFYQNECP